MLKASDRIKSFITAIETLQLNVYDDGFGNLTIGWGHKLAKNDPTKIITEDIAKRYFDNDISIVEIALNNMIKIVLAQREFDALISLVFNIGIDAFMHSSIFLYINQGNKIEAATWFTRWSHSGRTAIEGLLLRRIKEVCIFSGIPIKDY